MAQGTVSVLRGGKFAAGFASSFISSVAAPLIKGGGRYISTAKAAILGGTVSRLVGGKFANGAVSGAFVHLFNDLGERSGKAIKRAYNALERRVIGDSISDNPISLSDLDVRTMIDQLSIKGRAAFSAGTPLIEALAGGLSDTFLRYNDLSSETINYNGSTYLGGEVNYIGVGAYAAAYGVPDGVLTSLVAGWNVGQYLGFNTYGSSFQSHNLTTIPSNTYWAVKAYSNYR